MGTFDALTNPMLELVARLWARTVSVNNFVAPDRNAERSHASAKTSDTNRYGIFFRALLDRGVYLAPSQFEALFVSHAHTDEALESTAHAIEDALSVVASAV